MDQTTRELTSVIIESALFKMGPLEAEMVESKLDAVGLNFELCLKFPDALKQILFDLYGKASDDILLTIDESLKRISMNDELENFITVLKS